MNTILGRSSIIFSCFLIILIGNFILTMFVISEQKDDGLTINLSGRQRMLSQKLAKEVFIYQFAIQEKNKKDISKMEKKIEATVKLFETTLFALKDGGSIPTNLDMTKFRTCTPATSKETIAQLEIVINLWKLMKKNVNLVMDSQGTDTVAASYISAKNVELLEEMNKAVGLMQKEAEQKISKISNGQIAALIFGFLISIIGFITMKKSVVDPLSLLSQASEKMSAGDLKGEISVGGTKEISKLSVSINKMRISLDGMINLLKSK